MYSDESLASYQVDERSNTRLLYIDKSNYNALMDKSFDINSVAELLEKPNDKVSLLTRAYLVYMNEKINKVLLNTNGRIHNFETIGIERNKLDMRYVVDTFKEKMSSGYQYEKYYELKLLANRDILVVVCDGFLNNITESKDNLLKFILECLSYTYKLNYRIYGLYNLYIKMKLNNNYIDMLKLRS